MAAAAQTRVDLRTQARDVDFSGAASTKPFKTGTSLPATCAAGGDVFQERCAAGTEPVCVHFPKHLDAADHGCAGIGRRYFGHTRCRQRQPPEEPQCLGHGAGGRPGFEVECRDGPVGAGNAGGQCVERDGPYGNRDGADGRLHRGAGHQCGGPHEGEQLRRGNTTNVQSGRGFGGIADHAGRAAGQSAGGRPGGGCGGFEPVESIRRYELVCVPNRHSVPRDIHGRDHGYGDSRNARTGKQPVRAVLRQCDACELDAVRVLGGGERRCNHPVQPGAVGLVPGGRRAGGGITGIGRIGKRGGQQCVWAHGDGNRDGRRLRVGRHNRAAGGARQQSKHERA